MPELLEPEETLETLQLIDSRQDLLLEDLDRLNERIVNIIEVYSNNRQPDNQPKKDAA